MKNVIKYSVPPTVLTDKNTFQSQLRPYYIWMASTKLIPHNVVLSAGCDRLHLLLQDPHECPGPARTAGQPVAHRQQHHRLPPSPHPLGPLLPAGPAGAAASPPPPAQPPQRAAPAGPQVVQPKETRPPFPPHLQTLSSPPSSFIQDPVQFTDHVKTQTPSDPSNPMTHLPKRSEVFAHLLLLFVFLHTVNVLFYFFILPLKRFDTKYRAWDEVVMITPNVSWCFFSFLFFL